VKKKAVKPLRTFVMFSIIALCSLQMTPAHAGLEDILKGVKEAVGLGGELSETRIIDGLKEALRIGSGNAVNRVSQIDGFYKNAQIRIPLPGSVRKVEKILRAAGYGTQVDAFQLSMNRAAERAAPEARSLFWDAIKEMTFSDARKILHGRDNEATLYFKDKTLDPLGRILEPIIHTSMSQVGVTRKYQELEEKVRKIPFADALLAFDLDKYVTDQALGGLFHMLAEEERKIRQNPSARVTDLLKEVFGSTW